MCNWKSWIFPGLFTVAILSALAVWMNYQPIQNELAARATSGLAEAGQSWATVEMDGRDATLRGSSPSDEATAQAVAIADSAYDVRVVDTQVELLAAQSPYTLTATRTEGAVTLSGFVPDEAARETVLAAAASSFPDAEVRDELVLASGAPDGFSDLTAFGFSQIEGIDDGVFALSDTNVSVSGRANDIAIFDNVNNALTGALPGSGALAENAVTPPVASPYTWGAAYDGSEVELTGFVPNDKARASILAETEAALPNASVKDSQVIADGAPADFTDAAAFGLQQLTRFSAGSANLSDLDLTIDGDALDGDAFDAAQGAVSGDLPAGLSLASAAIRPVDADPYTFNANYTGEAVTLTGFAPDDQTRTEIGAAAEQALPDASVDNQLRIANGAPEGYAGAVGFGLSQLPRFTEGSVALTGLDLDVRGIAKDVPSFDNAESALVGNLPDGLTVASSEITPPTVTPYVAAAEYDSGTIRLTGFGPDEAAIAGVEEAARAAVPDAEIVNEMKAANGAPAAYGAKTQFGLSQLTRFSSGAVTLTDSTLDVTGVAKDAETFQAANDAIAGDLPSELALGSVSIVPATVTPYTWAANTEEQGVVLTGFAPDSDARDAVVAKAQSVFPDAEVTNRIQIARGEPDNYADKTAYALDRLSALETGEASLSDSALSIRGRAATPDTFDAVNASLDNDLQSGLTLASRDISAPTASPYTFSATGDGNTVVLDGFVPDEDTRAALIAAAQEARPDATIEDRMRLADGAPASYPTRTAEGIEALAQLDPASASLSDEQLTISGRATDYDNYTAATGRYGALAATTANIEPSASTGDYEWRAERTSDTIILSGKTPAEDVRADIAAKAASTFPDATIENRMIVESGAPDGFREQVDTSFARLALLEEGSASITNTDLAVRGRTGTMENFDAVNSDLDRDPAEGYALVDRQITPPVASPYVWSVVDTEAGSTIEGFVPNRGLGNANVAASRSVLGGDVTDNQQVAAGEPDGFGNAVAAIIGSVGQMEDGRGSLQDKAATVEGRTDSEARANRIRARLKDDLDRNGYTLTDKITYPEPEPEPAPEPEEKVVAVTPKPEPEAVATCNTDFKALFDGEKVQFATAKAVIQPVSFPLLDRIAAGLDGCSEKNIEVGGHTDSRGSERYNQGLSEARASSVVTYLRDKGVDVGGLKAVGFGESQPVAPNGSPIGRAANRRIEFTVVE